MAAQQSAYPTQAAPFGAPGPPPPIPSRRPDVPQPPAAGQRIPFSTDTPFPDPSLLPPSSLHDSGGPEQVVYVGSAIFQSSVHPCKIAPHLDPPVRVPYGGGEHEHRGRFDLLPINDQTMEWVLTAQGKIPPGRTPVEGGYEENGARLYHAIVSIDNVWVPGKTGVHLVRDRSCNIF
ncbi:hypothetical protein JB92DRAFT_2968773 [Gautieria morchelliformis]|nr:hypothetical protein JB92DRAFT_2968773 [Gautieria morchelliformis]